MKATLPVIVIEWLRQEYDVTKVWIVEGLAEISVRASASPDDWIVNICTFTKPNTIEVVGPDLRESFILTENSIVAYGKTFAVGDPEFFVKLGKIMSATGIRPHQLGTDKPEYTINGRFLKEISNG